MDVYLYSQENCNTYPVHRSITISVYLGSIALKSPQDFIVLAAEHSITDHKFAWRELGGLTPPHSQPSAVAARTTTSTTCEYDICTRAKI